MSALARFADHLIDDTEVALLLGGDLHGYGSLGAVLGRSPQDGSAALWADDRIDRVVQSEDDVTNGQAERTARAAFAGDDDDDRGPQAGHHADGLGDGFGDASLLGRSARDSALHVHKGQDRHAESLGQLHHPHGLAVALGLRQTEVAANVLLGVLALLETAHDDPPAGNLRNAGHYGRVIAEEPVAVQLDELVGHAIE